MTPESPVEANDRHTTLPGLCWPGGRHVAVVLNVAYEVWSQGQVSGVVLTYWSTHTVTDDQQARGLSERSRSDALHATTSGYRAGSRSPTIFTGNSSLLKFCDGFKLATGDPTMRNAGIA